MTGIKPNGLDEIVADIDLQLETEAVEKRADPREEPSSSLVGTLTYRNQTLPVRISDLSMGGVSVTTDTGLPIGEDCELVIQLSVCGSDYELQIRSRICHSEPLTSRSYHAGLQFIDMNQSTRDTLKLLVR